MEIVDARIKKARGKHCVIGELDKARKVGRMMSKNVMGGCFSSATEAKARAKAMRDGTWKPKCGKRGKRRSTKRRARR